MGDHDRHRGHRDAGRRTDPDRQARGEVNIQTLTAFILVSIGVVVLRRKRADVPRAFTVPFSPVLSLLSAAICFSLMLNLSIETWLRFVIWMESGFAIYFIYGYRTSRLATGKSLAESRSSR